MPTSRERSVVIVTGAASGIGRACALRFASEGYNVLATDIARDKLQLVRRAIEEAGGTAMDVAGDVGELATSEGCVATAISCWGRVDVLVANAGVQTAGSLTDISDTDRDRIIATNVFGVANACKATLPAMLERKTGAIVITSSINAMLGARGMAYYDASKSAVLGLMRSLAAEYGGHGIRVNAVCPGVTITDYHIERFARRGISEEQIREMTEGYGALERAAQPDEIAAAIFFLAGLDASFITGHSLVVDGGYSIMSDR